MEKPTFINEVCKKLGMTSRTIRYYEQLGLIRTIRDSRTAPRTLDEENIKRLQTIRFLRKLGLALDEIAEVIDSDTKAREMIFSKTAELKAEIASLADRIGLLEEVLDAAEKGGNIYAVEQTVGLPPDADALLRVGAAVTNLLLERRYEELRQYLSTELRSMPDSFFASCWESHLKPCGNFIAVGEQTISGHTVISRLVFEKRGVIVKVDVYGKIAATLLLQYYNLKQ